jgi:hypothetical protein
MVDKAELSDEGDRLLFKEVFIKAWQVLTKEEQRTELQRKLDGTVV